MSQLDWPNFYICTVNLSYLLLLWHPINACWETVGWARDLNLVIFMSVIEDTTLCRWGEEHTHKYYAQCGWWGKKFSPTDYESRSQSLMNRSLCDVISTERGHTDGMQCSLPFELNGKDPSVLLTPWINVRMYSCTSYICQQWFWYNNMSTWMTENLHTFSHFALVLLCYILPLFL